MPNYEDDMDALLHILKDVEYDITTEMNKAFTRHSLPPRLISMGFPSRDELFIGSDILPVDHTQSSLATPAKEPCKFLVQRVVDSNVSGAPQGIVQECTHPNQNSYKSLLRLFEKFVIEILGVVQRYDNSVHTPHPLVILPYTPKVVLASSMETLRSLCVRMNNILQNTSHFQVHPVESTTKEFTDGFSEKQRKRTLE